MKIIMMSGALLFLPFVFSGCAKSEQERALSDMVDYLDEMTEILETVEDRNTAVQAIPELQELGQKMEAATARMASSFDKKTPQEMQSLMLEYEKPMADAGQRFTTELMRVCSISDVGENFQQLFGFLDTGSTGRT